MKKLNKLQINPERILKTSELKSLKGGYDDNFCYGHDSLHCLSGLSPCLEYKNGQWICSNCCMG